MLISDRKRHGIQNFKLALELAIGGLLGSFGATNFMCALGPMLRQRGDFQELLSCQYDANGLC